MKRIVSQDLDMDIPYERAVLRIPLPDVNGWFVRWSIEAIVDGKSYTLGWYLSPEDAKMVLDHIYSCARRGMEVYVMPRTNFTNEVR